MAIELLNRLIMFVALWLAQVLILNRIHLFDVATPLLYVFFVITFRRSSPKWQFLLWCFALGLLIDVFSNTPGLAAGSMTLMLLSSHTCWNCLSRGILRITWPRRQQP